MTDELTFGQLGRAFAAGTISTLAVDDWRASIALHGEFDASNADQLREVLDGHLDDGRRVLRIDTREITFIDSSAVGAIVHAHARCQREHGSLILTGVHSRTARLFEITGLDRVFLIDTAGDNAPAERADAATEN